MKRKINSIKNPLLTAVLGGCLVLLSGCTSLSYVGDDFDSKKVQHSKQVNCLLFSTYTKTSDEENIDMKLGLQNPLPDALVVYINVKK